MTTVKTIHEIVTPDKLYPANTTVRDMPEDLIEEMRLLNALVIVEEKAPLPTIKRRKTRLHRYG